MTITEATEQTEQTQQTQQIQQTTQEQQNQHDNGEQQVASVILYEYPLNERIRTYLRLEDLFQRINYFLESDSSYEHHAALAALFQICEICVRPDFKSDLISELERQKQALLEFENDPNISESALNDTIKEVEEIKKNIYNSNNRLGQHIKNNDWLMSICGRMNIPGGTCEFDLPNYHWWLSQDAKTRVKIFNDWLAPFAMLIKEFSTILRLLRGSGRCFDYTTEKSILKLNLGSLSLSNSQLAQIVVDKNIAAVPKISANKYFLNIRFVKTTLSELKPKNYDENNGEVPFKIILCQL